MAARPRGWKIDRNIYWSKYYIFAAEYTSEIGGGTIHSKALWKDAHSKALIAPSPRNAQGSTWCRVTHENHAIVYGHFSSCAARHGLTRYRHGQQKRCPHRVTTGSFTPSRQMLHSKYESSPTPDVNVNYDSHSNCILASVFSRCRCIPLPFLADVHTPTALNVCINAVPRSHAMLITHWRWPRAIKEPAISVSLSKINMMAFFCDV